MQIEYNAQKWKVETENIDNVSCNIGLYLLKEGEWVRYGSMSITKDPASCSLSFVRNTMPYVVVREIIKIADFHINRIGVKFSLVVTET